MSDSGPVTGNAVAASDEPTFEQALARLEEIVESLEDGQMSLEDSLKRFEEGMGLRGLCTRQLQEAETRIEQVLAESAEEPNPESVEDDEFRLR